MQFLPETVDGKFEIVDAIPCDATDASFRMAAVTTEVDDAIATKVCQRESERVGQKLLLWFAGPREGGNDQRNGARDLGYAALGWCLPPDS